MGVRCVGMSEHLFLHACMCACGGCAFALHAMWDELGSPDAVLSSALSSWSGF